MKPYLLIATFALGAVVATAQSHELNSEVRVTNGLFHGSARDGTGVLAFKGIPYAAPPLGDLRWKAPQAASPWTDVRDATVYGSKCWSALVGMPMPGPAPSENCLTLNVWTAARQPSERRPVMVWIHGGGFEFGSSSEVNTDGAGFAAKGVVLVSVNYRLGVFGFLAHPDLDKEGPSGDYGLQDQIAALKWVQANIASFGGDPSNITVFGESAGSHAIGILMASPLSAGLFQKAIGSSGAFWDGNHGSLATFQEAHALGVKFSSAMGTKTIAELRAVPPERLNASATWNFSTDPITTAFSPNVDGFVIPAIPASRFAEGKQLKIPLLAGWNDHEDIPFGMWALPHKTAKGFRTAAAQVFGDARMEEFLSLYPGATDAEAAQSATELAGDMVIAQQTWEWLDLQRKTAKTPVYGYKFTYTSAFSPAATHASDVPFVFGTLTPSPFGPKREPAEADRKMAALMMTYLTNFARSGDPNGSGLPRWPAFDGTTVLELGNKVTATTPKQIARFRFLSSFRKDEILPASWRDSPRPDPPPQGPH